MNYLAENIRVLRKQKNYTQAELAAKLGVNRSLIGAYEEGRAEPRLKTLQAICLLFKVGLHELVNEDLSKGKNRTSPDITGQKLRILPIVVDTTGEEQISLIPQKAAAGYIQGYSDMEFIEQLTTAHLPFPELPGQKTYRIFQIEGDSMLPVQSGSYIIAEYVDNWKEIRSNECYVLLTRNDGIVYKRLVNDIHEKQGLTLKSDNTLYSSYFLPAEDILEVWRAKGVLSFAVPDNSFYTEQLNQKVLDMMDEIRQEVKELGLKISNGGDNGR